MNQKDQEAIDKMLRLEAHEKKFGDTARMRARMGLKTGEIPDRAWTGDYISGGSTCRGRNHGESKSNRK